ISSLRDNEIAQIEIERARRLFESRWLRRLETAEGQASYLAEWEAQGGWQMGADYYDRFLRAEGRAVAAAAAQFLSDDRCGTVVYRPATAAAVATGAEDFRSRTTGSGPR